MTRLPALTIPRWLLVPAALGALLVAYGLTSDAAIYERSLGYNVNVGWGLCLLAFGLVCLLLARRGARTSRPADETPGGRDTEAREHATGLEGP